MNVDPITIQLLLDKFTWGEGANPAAVSEFRDDLEEFAKQEYQRGLDEGSIETKTERRITLWTLTLVGATWFFVGLLLGYVIWNYP